MRATLLIALFFVCAISMSIAQNDKKAVKDCFFEYKSHILKVNGEEAVQYVDSRTIQYYTDILKTTIEADSAEVNELSILDKLMILSLRHRASKEELIAMDGKTLIVYAVDQGMIGKNSVANNELGDIRIEGDAAKAQLVVNGQKSPLYFDFYREEGNWKMDLTSIFPATSSAFDSIVKNSGKSENEFLTGILETLTQRTPSPEIWHPLE